MREPDAPAPDDGPDPGVHHLFDRQFKRLLAMSGPATVALVNGLFDLDLPLDSPVTTLSGEHLDPGLARTDLDLILRVAGETVHFEGQSRYDRDIAVRVFAYEWGKAARDRRDDATHVTFARGKVVYLGPVRAPLEERLVLHFPDDPPATFTLRAVRVSDHTAAELAG
ncbi:MAG: hypothetical protein LBS56_01625, partial [Propionibacteriaceae bacterium]|nr:hypothetical protein [Propionibacteriaceae bacterium]